MHLEKVEFNPLVQQDVKNMLSYFDQISDIVGNKVFEDFTNRIDQISKNPYRFPPFRTIYRKAQLKHYPFDIVYRVIGKRIRILVFKHQERHDDYGMSRC